MKIIQVITSFDLGGAERVAINIASSKSPNFHYYLFEVVKGHSEFTEQLKKEFIDQRITFFCSPFKNKKLAICFFWIWFIVKYISIKPDIIHSHTEIPDIALWIFRKIGWIFFWIRPYYVRTIHNTELWNSWKNIGKIIEKYYIKNKCNISISSSTQENYVHVYGGEFPPIIYNGIKKVPQKKFPYLKHDKYNILFAGRFEKQKGINELLNIITKLKDNNSIFFHIVGDGSMKNYIQDQTRGYTNVKIYPKIYGLSAFLGSFDYIFMPSIHEGLALLPIEASLAYTPTIINSCPGLKDTLPDDWELSVKNNSLTDYFIIFSNLKKYNYKELCNKAYNHAISFFSISRMQKEYEKFYKQKI